MPLVETNPPTAPDNPSSAGTSPPVTVRPGRPSDAARIALFNLRLAAETEELKLDPSTVERGVKAGLADPAKAAYYVAELPAADGGPAEVVGCLMITREWSDWRDGDLWWIQSVFVDPDARRRGVFAALFAHAEQAARSAGAVGLRLYVDAHNDAARRTYRQMGMSDTQYGVMEKMLPR